MIDEIKSYRFVCFFREDVIEQNTIYRLQTKKKKNFSIRFVKINKKKKS